MRGHETSKILVLLAIAFSQPIGAATPEEIRQEILSKFTITTRSAVGRVQNPGSVLVVQKEGIRADPPRTMMKPSKIRDGELVEVGGGSFFGNSGHSLAIGQRLHLYRLDVKEKYVLLLLATAETHSLQQGGGTESVPLEAAVSFRYEKGIANVTTEQVVQNVGDWFKTESDSAEAASQSISLGQSLDEVIAVLGQPKKKVDLGKKVVFIYEDMKVIFLDEKVEDVE